ncbi:MAG: hypothetical protein WC710_14870 [Gallionella sp.]|jgi:hypothetical protein
MKKVALLLSMLSCTALADNADTCASYNFTPDTPEFSNCLMQLDIAQHQQAAQDMAQRRAAAMQMYRPFTIAPSTYNYQMPTNQRQQTNCRWIANVWNCQ